MSKTPPNAVTLAVREWLTSMTPCFTPIFDQLAHELAPVVADQVLTQMRDMLAGLQTRDQLLWQLTAALTAAENHLDLDPCTNDEWREQSDKSTRNQIRAALHAIALYRGFVSLDEVKACEAEDLAGEGGEGGAQ